MIEAVKVVASVREPAMLEPIPTVVTLNESITITMLETATLAAFCEPRSTSPGPSKAAAVMPRHCAVMAMAAAVTARHCAVMATATMASAVAAASAAPAATPAPAVAAASAAATTPAAAAAATTAAMAHEGHCATGAESAFQVGDTCRLSRPPHEAR
jgi:hypothetical protein